MVAQDSHFQTLTSRLALALQAADSPSCARWSRHAEQPDNFALSQELAVQYNQAGRQEEALGLLWTFSSATWRLAMPEKTYLDILTTMGSTPGGAELSSQTL
ncbi:tetratricopeptide repeat protein [Aeromonas sp. A-5]|uniref:tetratricopeptide repeat protein n=1 Tax=Aeromonas ichthyocola TaxID=3367746 RepID=UPI0038E77FE4